MALTRKAVENTYRIYMAFMEKHTPGKWPLSMSEGIKEAVHFFLQMEDNMRKQAVEHPLPVRDLKIVIEVGCGRKRRKDVKNIICV